jgi:hypothetical protein
MQSEIEVTAEQCQRCGSANPPWSCPSPLWNAVMRGGSINGDSLYGDMVCATCFTIIAEESGIAASWRLQALDVFATLETVTPSGRVWDCETGLWSEPADVILSGAYRENDGRSTG